MTNRTRPLRTLAAAGTLLASLLAAGVASAQYDGPRFRGGVALEGGALIAPSLFTLGSVGVQGQLGVQINNQWSIYALPTFDVLVGSGTGFNVGGAVLAELTLPGVPLSIGAGPEASYFVVLNGSSREGFATGFSGQAYGGRLRFAVHPVIAHGDDGIRRKALTIGVDLRVMEGAFGNADALGNATLSFGVSPVVWLGYTAF